MFLQKRLFDHANKAMRTPLTGMLRTAAVTAQPSLQTREYFSVFEKIKDRFRAPMRHI